MTNDRKQRVNLDDYITVNERLAAFREEFPEGSIQSEIVELTDDRVTVKAYAYRSPDDTRPGIGHSWLEIPGRTNFTRGSELENAETSAWGRALAALGFEVKRGIATSEEVRNKQRDGEADSAPPPARSTATAPSQTFESGLGRCSEHGIEWVRSAKTGQVGHMTEDGQVCLRPEETADETVDSVVSLGMWAKREFGMEIPALVAALGAEKLGDVAALLREQYPDGQGGVDWTAVQVTLTAGTEAVPAGAG